MNDWWGGALGFLGEAREGEEGNGGAVAILPGWWGPKGPPEASQDVMHHVEDPLRPSRATRRAA